MQERPGRLGASERLVSDERTELILSAVSSWEIAIKYALGRLVLPEPPSRYVPDRLLRSHTTSMPIEHSHALQVATLPPVHGDPFDRLLIAQAQILGIPILTGDPVFRRYDVEVIGVE